MVPELAVVQRRAAPHSLRPLYLISSFQARALSDREDSQVKNASILKLVHVNIVIDAVLILKCIVQSLQISHSQMIYFTKSSLSAAT